MIEEKKKERELYQEKINTLAKNRQEFIAEEMKKQADGVKKDDFGTSVNESLLKKATELGIKEVVFDRSGYIYHGRIKAVAEGAREGGLDF